MALTRIIRIETTMACCRDGQEAYRPLPKPIRAEVVRDDFETSLTVWRDRASSILYNKYSTLAENECAGMGTLRLCMFNLSVTSVNEYGQPTTPTFVMQQIEMLEERMDKAEDYDEYILYKRQIDLYKTRYGIQTEEEYAERR